MIKYFKLCNFFCQLKVNNNPAFIFFAELGAYNVVAEVIPDP
jgi:hypothetical protein